MKNAARSHGPIPRTIALDDEPGDKAAYEEYLRGFDDVPVLQDVVRIPPRRMLQPDFRRGERRDARQEPRSDAYSLREATLAEIEFLYQEYTQPGAVAPPLKRKKRQKRPSGTKAKTRAKSKKR